MGGTIVSSFSLTFPLPLRTLIHKTDRALKGSPLSRGNLRPLIMDIQSECSILLSSVTFSSPPIVQILYPSFLYIQYSVMSVDEALKVRGILEHSALLRMMHRGVKLRECDMLGRSAL